MITINTFDISTWGLEPSKDGFYSNVMKDSGLKDRIVGDYPDTNGVIVQLGTPYVKSQDISLAFLCDTYAHYRTFLSYCVTQKVVDMHIQLTTETLRLEYLSCPSFNYYGSYILFTVNFREANPANRT